MTNSNSVIDDGKFLNRKNYTLPLFLFLQEKEKKKKKKEQEGKIYFLDHCP